MKPVSDDDWKALVREAVQMPAAPPAWVAQALKIFPAAAAPARAKMASPSPVLERLWAVLRFDSWAMQPAMAGLRALPSDVQQLMFSAQDIDIDLRITPQGEGFELMGQVFGPAEQVCIDWQQEGGMAAPASTPLNATNEFRITGLHRGTCTVSLRWPKGEVRLPPLQLGRADGTPLP
jgi:hypothetical protein